jgi:hypothetical protein
MRVRGQACKNTLRFHNRTERMHACMSVQHASEMHMRVRSHRAQFVLTAHTSASLNALVQLCRADLRRSTQTVCAL